MTGEGTVNIASALADAARRDPAAPALVLPDGTRVSYRDLDADADRIARGLGGIGLAPGTRAVLMVPPGRDFFPLVFGLFRAGAVPVVVDPGMGVARMRSCLEEAKPGAFIGIAKAHAARVLLGLGGPTVRIRVGVGACFGLGGVSLDRVRRLGGSGGASPALTKASDTAAILFTSGSTGPPRGAVYTHGNLSAQVEMVRRTFGIEPGEIDLPTFPLFALFDPALGMTTVVPDMDPARPARADPRRIARAILENGVTTMFASPGLLDPLSLYCEVQRVRFPSLRRVISAGAPVSPRIVERMAKALPEGALLHTPYGATEALPVASIDHRTILGETRAKAAAGAGICVGKPVEGVEVCCIRVDDGPIASWTTDLEVPRGTPGEICVRGPQVTERYFARADANRLSKIQDPVRGFWHRMGDVGYFDDQGRVWFCGRKSQRVRTAAGDLYADQCEGVFDVVEGVRAAVVGVGPPGGQKPVVCLEAGPAFRVETAQAGEDRPDTDATARIGEEMRSLAGRYEVTRSVRDFLWVEDTLPVDTRHNAKIQREELARWAAKRIR